MAGKSCKDSIDCVSQKLLLWTLYSKENYSSKTVGEF